MDKNYSSESVKWQDGIRQRNPYSPPKDKPEPPANAPAPRIFKDPRSRIRWKSLFYFIISACVVQKIISYIYSLLPFPISILAILALTAKLSESWLDSQGFNTLVRFLQNLINLSEDQIDAGLKRIWHHASLQEQASQGTTGINDRAFSQPSNSCKQGSKAVQQSERDLQTAQGIFLRQAAIKKFIILHERSENLRKKLFSAGFLGSSDQYMFNPAIKSEFKTHGILGISFSLKNFGGLGNEIALFPVTGVMQVTARVDLGDLLVDDPEYFVLTHISIIADDSWKEVVVLEN
ncbi:hypothetical protein DSO57_1025000 [Entomophthora muscae]|uniref:Uncharacterized protein n=1 Tax=Entomophthora muscae TaxID=34485 RepID=A0ACC2U1H4_9FUNG|nr:hypothetical protein DSO57_1025000 [Entomophthora muscae]